MRMSVYISLLSRTKHHTIISLFCPKMIFCVSMQIVASISIGGHYGGITVIFAEENEGNETETFAAV